MSGDFDPNCADTCCWFSCSMLTQNLPLASMACQARDTLVGQNSTSGGSSDSAAKDWQANPIGTSVVHRGDHGDTGAELPEHIPERAGIDLCSAHWSFSGAAT